MQGNAVVLLLLLQNNKASTIFLNVKGGGPELDFRIDIFRNPRLISVMSDCFQSILYLSPMKP